MERAIQITQEENDEVQSLYLLHMSYLNILKFFAKSNLTETQVYERKWNDAVLIGAELERTKQLIEQKYKPEGQWNSFTFNFDKEQVIFENDNA